MRAFVCIEITSRYIHDIISKIRDTLELKEKPIKVENLHFTLAFLGEIDSSDRVMAALQRVKMEPFHITLSGLGAFPSAKNPRILWMNTTHGSESLIQLANDIQESLMAINYYTPTKKFKPHLTICRIKHETNFGNKLEEFSNESFHSQSITKFKLKQSVLDSKGAIYSDLGEVRLG